MTRKPFRLWALPFVIAVAVGSACAESPPRGAAYEFDTDFDHHSIPYDEILSGGPPKDGIPAIDDPAFVSVEGADGWLGEKEGVVVYKVGDDVRAYPLQILMWHELVNDQFGNRPVTISYCPLCNTAIAYDGRVGDHELTFGTTGRLRYSNMVMYDRETESWWQQADGKAIVGELLGQKLSMLPAPILSWTRFKTRYPLGRVLSKDTGHRRDYGRNPYRRYDAVGAEPFLYQGPETDRTLRSMTRIVAVEQGTEATAYTYDDLAEQSVINDTVDGLPVALFWREGAASALDKGRVAEGRDIGMVTTYVRRLGERILVFERSDDGFEDGETETTWNIHGEAVAGPLKGQRLAPVVHINHFWFSYFAFRPDVRVYGKTE